MACCVEGSWNGVPSWIPQLMGISATVASLLSNAFVWDSVKLILLGFIVETGRRILTWVIRRFRLRFSISAEFHSGPAYEWLVSYLTKENVWRESRDFIVQTKTSQRSWTIRPRDAKNHHVDYIPAYGSLHFFRWNGYWLELSSTRDGEDPAKGPHTASSPSASKAREQRNPNALYLTLYTLDMSVLFAFVEECRLRYVESSKAHVTIHSINQRQSPFAEPEWNSVKTKHHRPLESLILDMGVMDDLLGDAREFLTHEDWYVETGIPHRRGYLLHGPPGTGKSSTVYAIAGALGLEIYSLSLASLHMDDTFLTQAISSMPPQGILLIEDIDCAFPSRDDEEDPRSSNPKSRSQVTLSGLLNILDGIGSQEGKIFFCTARLTNHVDRLDPALLRPGRIDRMFEYKLANKHQTYALFDRFFPASRFAEELRAKGMDLKELSDEFSQTVPENEFSIADLQGYLMECKSTPRGAVLGIQRWVEREREAKKEREKRIELDKQIRRENEELVYVNKEMRFHRTLDAYREGKWQESLRLRRRWSQ